ncbi:MAG: UDP-N-acetylmuramoyl-L-alanine--D-glutamate ligase [Burkholderia sp.]|nr:UDP-N-acetylmuramoyl-L-alanine--D-glutamate ligase [Burkholderia sp.]
MFDKVFENRQNLMVLILGLGKSGLAIARWCSRHKYRIRIADTREVPPNLAALKFYGINAEFVSGTFSTSLLDNSVGLIGISPSLSPLMPDLASLIETAKERAISVWGELEFFSYALRTLSTKGYRPKVIAITGTNGKTTTTTLTGMLCKHADKLVIVAGNTNSSMLNCLLDAFDKATLPDIWVLELSSFQLETSYTFSPDVAAILNITQDHLDWHGNFHKYTAAKQKIFGEKTIRVLNRNDVLVMKAAQHNVSQTITFGLNLPDREGDFGVSIDNEAIWLVEALNKNREYKSILNRYFKRSSVNTKKIRQKYLVPETSLNIRGMHNIANALAALALVRAIGLQNETILKRLCEFRGKAHRGEIIATIDDVDYIDDSKGTNVGATTAAINTIARRIVLIAGGDGKGQDFSLLVDSVSRWCRAVILIGRDAPALRDALAETSVPHIVLPSLEVAVYKASVLAQPGDVVLLSPACSSFDMFRNYHHRSEIFRQAVDGLLHSAKVKL